ncbi:MAG: hypothetical protein H5U40_14895 [Polyangiaceae bacterium]|nr:hypothetical protein [Polyangiaceae bacterium]
MPITSPCMPGLGDGATVAPLSRIEYAVVNPRDHAELLPLRNSTMTAEEEAALGLAPSVLVRREIAFDDGAVIDGTTRVILEYVADFDIRFVVDTTPPPAAARTFTVVEDAPAQNLANPENIRSVIVRLSARTPGTQPQFAKPTAPRDAAGNVPLTRFTVGGTAPGAARVRTTEVEIFLPNLLPRS